MLKIQRRNLMRATLASAAALGIPHASSASAAGSLLSDYWSQWMPWRDTNPEPIIQIASSFMSAKFLLVANEIGLFEKLAEGPATLDELAKRTGIPRRTTRMVVDAMVSLGLVENRKGQYLNGHHVATFLSGGPGADLRPQLRRLNRLQYPQWQELEAAVRSDGGHTRYGTLSEDELKIDSEGMAALTTQTALALASVYDFSRHQHVLDLGGGTGNFLVVILNRYPKLAGTLYELPDTAAVARRVLAGTAEGARINVVDGDFFADSLPQGADATILANIIHLFSPTHSKELLERIRRQSKTGSRLLLIDFWTDPTHTQPAPTAMLAGEFLLVAGEGDVYSAQEIQDWLRDTSWRLVQHQRLPGPASLIVADAI
jgi:SAM-dependent methyltransferase